MSSHVEFVTAGAVALALLCGPPVSALRQDVTLRYRWTKGETIRYRIVQQSTTTIYGHSRAWATWPSTSRPARSWPTVAEEVAPDGTHDAAASRRVGEDGDELSDVRDGVRQRESRRGANPMSAMLKSIVLRR